MKDKKQRDESKIEIALEYSNSIIATLREPFLVLDKDLRVISANRSFYDTFKVAKEDTIGRMISDLGNRQWDIPKLIFLFEKILPEKKVVKDYEVEHEFEQIGQRTMIVNACQLRVSKKIAAIIVGMAREKEGGEEELILVAIEDISKRKKAERALQESLQAKSAFTSMVSHELRTPMGALKESVSLMSEGILGPVNEEQKRFLGIAKSNVDRLARLINEVLDFQTLEAGKVAFKMEENDLNAVVKEVLESMVSLAEKKDLDFTLNLDENLPKVRFDRDKIIQVLTNLVSNSVKLTEKGGISITTSLGNNVIQASVQDTGPGIKEEDMPRLFQQYEQLERKVGGTGLGLAISLEIIEAHGGKIWAESKLGQGTTFHFVLPIKERRSA